MADPLFSLWGSIVCDGCILHTVLSLHFFVWELRCLSPSTHQKTEIMTMHHAILQPNRHQQHLVTDIMSLPVGLEYSVVIAYYLLLMPTFFLSENFSRYAPRENKRSNVRRYKPIMWYYVEVYNMTIDEWWLIDWHAVDDEWNRILQRAPAPPTDTQRLYA